MVGIDNNINRYLPNCQKDGSIQGYKNMNIRVIMQLTAAIFGLSVTMGLPTPQSNAPTLSTLLPTTVNPHLMPNPCGGEIDMDYIPNEEELSESIHELLPNTIKIKSKVEGLKTIMAANRIQNKILRSIVEKKASSEYNSDAFPYPNNLFSGDMFSDLYKNMSMVEIYYSNLAEVEKSHHDDNDAEILGHLTEVTDAAQKIRCHLSIILRFHEQIVPSVDFQVEPSKIDNSSRVSRYIKHYQIFYMTEVFVESVRDLFSTIF
ncbi:hypothetical protein LOTGIDRAFT_238478 [Lottia gigantea]|uniref:Uncharacterized protein n=1 Tax=Lottia gigantea TaxID=225164 RepID=V4CFQ3_LOTGI|nr:hypothetical protein LOTGIDRAFT_238478 [Lottia gigantea]ESP00850.1 hypothetical protein LOTGIDRAFT_238478 [Lottia gigantea]